MASPNATSLKDIRDGATRALLGNRCLANPGIAIGTTTTKAKTANAISYMIDGLLYSKAATDDLFAHSDVAVQPVSTTRYYALCLDASGTASIVAGKETANVDGMTYTLAVGMPAIASTLCCIGVIKIVTDSSHTFTPGTTAHGATGCATTYYNVGVIPSAGIPG